MQGSSLIRKFFYYLAKLTSNSFCFSKVYLVAVLVFQVLLENTSYSQSVRLTIEVKSANNQFHVVPLKENGVIIFYENSAKSQGARTERWSFTKLDTTLTEVWTVEYPLLNNLSFVNKFVDDIYVYLLFVKNSEYQIVKLDQETGEIFVNKAKFPKEAVDINNFVVVSNNAFIGGNIAPSGTTLFYRTCLGFACFPLLFIPSFLPEKSVYLNTTSLQTKLSRQINLELKGKSELLNLELDTINGRLNALVKNVKGLKSDLYIQELKYSGARSQITQIKTFTDQFQLIDGKVNCIDAQNKVVIGSYSRKGVNGAQGLYLTRFKNGKQEYINYQSFSKFEKFFEYLPKSEQLKLQQQIERKKNKGKDLDLSFQLLVHSPIIIDTNQYLIVAEIYYPQYHTEFRTTFYYGRPIETAVEVFDGWKYSHAIIAGLDNKGELLWDNSIVIQDILTFNLSEKIKILYNGVDYIAAYSYGSQIQYKVLSRDSLKTEKQLTYLEVDSDIERVKEQYNSDVTYWYKNFFIAYGIQKVKKLETDYAQSSGTVIYFNKIELKKKGID